MDTLIILAFFAPLILLILVLVRYASRIRRDAIDRDVRTEQLEALNSAIVRFVLERDEHTCQTCGAKKQVGVDFTGATPHHQAEVTAKDLEARCASCYLKQWSTLQSESSEDNANQSIARRLW
jgi:hypothetical protein